MTQSIISADTTGSNSRKSHDGQSLFAAVSSHLKGKRASFHTPGHKGRLKLDLATDFFSADLTELPGLDELDSASGVLASLQARAASIFGARKSFISVNGASAALTAAVVACRSRGRNLILPRNAHRSAINGMIIADLEPIWYEPDWLQGWETWGTAATAGIRELLDSTPEPPAALLVCSPNYAGCISNLLELSTICRERDILLIVDEAHGAHLSGSELSSYAALNCGADTVVHSLHKTLTAPTQTGLLHVGKECSLQDEYFEAALRLLQSSSPSYLLMLGIEKALDDVDGGAICRLSELLPPFKRKLSELPHFKTMSSEGAILDPLHIMLRHESISAPELAAALAAKGIYAETVLGEGLLLLLGLGTQKCDLDLLLSILPQLENSKDSEHAALPSRVSPEQEQSPRAAFFAASRIVSAQKAEGMIACDWIAPCPPGYAVACPGQRLRPESLTFLNTDSSVRVVTDPQLEGDSDGPNAAG